MEPGRRDLPPVVALRREYPGRTRPALARGLAVPARKLAAAEEGGEPTRGRSSADVDRGKFPLVTAVVGAVAA